MTDTSESEAVVLIAEDEEGLVDLYAEWLPEDYDVLTAYDGETALDRYDERVDVVLLDRRMPGMSGDEVLERIREQPGECRVAMVTAVEPDFDVLEMGFDDYLTKPISQDELHETVDGLLTRARYDQEVQEYFALASKRAALEAAKSSAELADDEQYGELTTRIEDLQDVLNTTAADLDKADYRAVLHDLDVENDRNHKELDEDDNAGR